MENRSGQKGQPERYDHLIKLVILGDSAVGKTNILLRFSSSEYKTTHLPTIGVDFKVKNLTVDGKKLKLQLWDTAGQERFKTITQTYYRGASGIILVYSVTDRSSFNNITKWINQIDEQNEEQIPKVLVGNKADVNQVERVVSVQEGQQLAERYKLPFFESSAKENININEIFETLSRMVVVRIESKTTPTLQEPTRRLGEAVEPQKKKMCC